MTLELTYTESSDTLEGDIDFTYEGTTYSGSTQFTRIE